MEYIHCPVKNCILCENPEILTKFRQMEKNCAYCEEKIINQSNTRYLRQGNMCDKCITIINEKHMKRIEELKLSKLSPQEKMEELSTVLENDNLEEEARLEVVNRMQDEWEELTGSKLTHFEIL